MKTNKRKRDNQKETKDVKFYMVQRCAYIHGQSNEQKLPLTNQMNALKSYNGEFSRKIPSQKTYKTQNINFLPNLIGPILKTLSKPSDQ